MHLELDISDSKIRYELPPPASPHLHSGPPNLGTGPPSILLLSLTSPPRYESGDHVAVYPANDSALVNQLGEILGADLDVVMSLNNLDGESWNQGHPPCLPGPAAAGRSGPLGKACRLSCLGLEPWCLKGPLYPRCHSYGFWSKLRGGGSKVAVGSGPLPWGSLHSPHWHSPLRKRGVPAGSWPCCLPRPHVPWGRGGCKPGPRSPGSDPAQLITGGLGLPSPCSRGCIFSPVNFSITVSIPNSPQGPFRVLSAGGTK